MDKIYKINLKIYLKNANLPKDARNPSAGRRTRNHPAFMAMDRPVGVHQGGQTQWHAGQPQVWLRTH